VNTGPEVPDQVMVAVPKYATLVGVSGCIDNIEDNTYQ